MLLRRKRDGWTLSVSYPMTLWRRLRAAEGVEDLHMSSTNKLQTPLSCDYTPRIWKGGFQSSKIIFCSGDSV